jgi:hypothetical protein
MGDWREELPETIRANPTLADVKAADAKEALATVAQRLIDTKALVGRSVRVPSKDSSPEARKEFFDDVRSKVPDLLYAPPDKELEAEVAGELWKRLGKPEKADEYQLAGIELEPGIQVDEGKARQLAAKLGMTKAQFKTLVKDVLGQEQLQQLVATKAEVSQLKAEWGAAYEERTVQAKAAALKMGVPEAALASLTPGELRVWANVAKSFAGQPTLGTQGPGGGGKPDPAEARAKVAELITRMSSGDWRPHINPAGHALGQKQLVELMELIPE